MRSTTQSIFTAVQYIAVPNRVRQSVHYRSANAVTLSLTSEATSLWRMQHVHRPSTCNQPRSRDSRPAADGSPPLDGDKLEWSAKSFPGRRRHLWCRVHLSIVRAKLAHHTRPRAPLSSADSPQRLQTDRIIPNESDLVNSMDEDIAPVILTSSASHSPTRRKASRSPR